MELHELVLRDPVAGWRVWESTHHRDYNESSEACYILHPAQASRRVTLMRAKVTVFH